MCKTVSKIVRHDGSEGKMDLHETLAYGRRGGFVYLRYVSVIFFFLSQFATYFVILNVLTQASNALNALQSRDIVGVVTSLVSFRLEGPSGTVVGIMRNLGCLVIPLYFIATISFVLNFNRGEIGKITRRTAVIAILLSFAELMAYVVLLGVVTVLAESLFALVAEQYSDIVGIVDQIIKAFNAEAELIPFESASAALAFAEKFVTERLTLTLLNNMPSFNIFLDQLLCLLLCVFFCFRPKWANTGAKRALFRALGVLPTAYIVAAFVFNGLMHSGVLSPSLTLMSLFPAKRLPHFLFIGCILYCNRSQLVRGAKREIGFGSVPSTQKIYRSVPPVFETAETAKRRSLQTAVFLSVCLLLLSAVDFLLGGLPFAAKWGLGKSYYAVFCIPFLFFFDERKPVAKRNYTVFSLVYFAVIVVVVLIYLFF